MPYPSSSNSSSQTHANHSRRYPDPNTLILHNPVPNTITQSHHSPHLVTTTTQIQNKQDPEQTTLNTAINSLNLGNPPPPHPPLKEPNNVQNPLPNPSSSASFALHPPWFPTKSFTLRWSWIEEEGPFITTGLQ